MNANKPYYSAIDLHGNNLFIAVGDSQGERIKSARLPCELHAVDQFLHPIKKRIAAVAVESTFNWYWLVDGLCELGYEVRLANPAGFEQYSGLKHADDRSDAYFMLEMMRLGILPTGHICSPTWRAVRDALRRRRMLVKHRTALLLSMRNLQMRNFGSCILNSANLQSAKPVEIPALFEDPSDKLVAEIEKAQIDVLGKSIARIERHVIQCACHLPNYEKILGIPGIGKILSMTIAMEIDTIERFPSAEKFASYARTVPSDKLSNGKRKGENNKRCGNRYLAWAFVEAANFIRRYDERASRWFDRKAAKTNKIVATKALSSKVAKVVYYILKTGEPYDGDRVFGPQRKVPKPAVRGVSVNQKKGLKIKSTR